MRTVAIVGVGLIGGSFALAIRKAGFTGTIIGVSSARTVEGALRLGVIDLALPLEQAVSQSDLVYLAQPIARILEILPAVESAARPGTLVTDVGSTKARIVDCARQAFRRARFLGGHPMAGKETRGVAAADAALFQNRTYFLTPEPAVEPDRQLLEWIRKIGALPVSISPEDHDRVVACVSHLPQLASTALAALLQGRPDLPGLERAAGPGLVDVTRLAMSSYEIWSDILDTNGDQIRAALSQYIEKLREFHDRIAPPDLADEFEIASDFAKRLRKGTR